MGPINIRYHVISLAGVFLALGVGIIVGSNTNFFGISALIERQDAVIGRLEANYRETRSEIRETKAELTRNRDYINALEETVVPQLLSGKLDGLSAGVVIIGGVQDEKLNETLFLSRIKAAGAGVAYKMRITLSRLDELHQAAPADFIGPLAAQLKQGESAGKNILQTFTADGTLTFGGFSDPVDAVIFILDAGLDQQLMRRILLPIESSIQDNGGMVINAVFTDDKNYKEIFSSKRYTYLFNISALPGQIEAITNLSELNEKHKEHK